MNASSVFALAFVIPVCIRGGAQSLNWTSKASLSSAAYVNGARSFGVATLNGKIYVAGGLNQQAPSDSAIATVFQYNPSQDVWVQKSDMQFPRYAPAAAAVGGYLYVLGGSTNTDQSDSTIVPLRSVEKYDPTNDTWTYVSSMNHGHWAFQAVTLNGKIYALGGLESSGAAIPSVEEYDPSADTWTPKADMPVARISFGAIAFNGKIYVFGGYYFSPQNVYVADVHVFDPASDTWATNSPMPTLRECLAVVVVNQTIWAMGGTSPTLGALATVEQFDPAQNTWASLPDLPTTRNECYGKLIGNTLYVFGGYNDWSMQAATIGPYGSLIKAVQPSFSYLCVGTNYQLQVSSDMINWTNQGAPFAATNTTQIYPQYWNVENWSQLNFRLQAAPQ